MTIHHADPWLTIHGGDCREVLATLPDQSVNCVVTSPPYWGLRDYGVTGQLGLESTPEEYVAAMVGVFREVRRVLRDDGTLWLNLGDSYATGAGKASSPGGGTQGERFMESGPSGYRGAHDLSPKHTMPQTPDGKNPGASIPTFQPNRMPIVGLKPKDLVGIPWMVAKALQAPYYTGRIKSEADRAWLAGWLDGEGTITYVERDRGPAHTATHDVRVFITNTDREPLDYFAAMTAGRVYQHEDGRRENRYGDRACFRWQMGTHDAALLLRELYPYLRTKRRQAALVWTLYTTLRHKNGHARTPDAIVSRRREIAGMVRTLNAGGDVTLPSWVEEPPSATEPGWYLRSDVIWAKPNPMPESVTDRPTKAHEYLFLLSKSPRYWYDADAVREDGAGRERFGNAGGKVAENGDRNDGGRQDMTITPFRNRRSVWSIATQPYPGAHFAVMPEALVEPCILAGCPDQTCSVCGAPWERIVERHGSTSKAVGKSDAKRGAGLATSFSGYEDGSKAPTFITLGWRPTCDHGAPAVPGVTLDPFGGSGTVARVANRLSRRAVLIDLNPDYLAQQLERNRDMPLGLTA